MAQVRATAQTTVTAGPEAVFAAITDYADVRPKLLTEHYSEYDVREGGKGAGTVAHWRLQATSKRSRDCLVTATEPAALTLVETDANSSMVTTWTVSSAGTGSKVEIVTVWNGAGGIGGFFEKTFAPAGLKRIYDGVLAKLPDAL